MSAYNFNSLAAHVGHDIRCICYGKESDPLNVALECWDCNEVLLDYDKYPDEED